MMACTPSCCAERNLLAAWVARASRAGVPRHQVVHWVRRKAGGSITGKQQHGAAASSRQQLVRLSNLEELLAGLGKLSTADAAFVASLVLHAVRLLQPAETLPLDLQLQQVTAWRMATPAVYLTFGIDDSVALLPVQLLSLLQQQLFAAVAYSTAMQQLEGARPLLPAGASDADVAASWGPVKQMLDILESCHGLRGCWVQHGLWAQVQTAAYQLLHEHRDGEFEQFFLLQITSRSHQIISTAHREALGWQSCS
ncbi:hypothetical protein OEZ85_001981 [Tetradesmus obliquus]|uniref:Uncharacterized protein n=1 Tax=Tetradesmus obliquus TaxID=3088 RepID=A0ABY8U1R5_TETOB|nr:hypothetical protein OEZ85_001981 [Tetradesmus obliquus]